VGAPAFLVWFRRRREVGRGGEGRGGSTATGAVAAAAARCPLAVRQGGKGKGGWTEQTKAVLCSVHFGG
jgi:hypothetical protein